MHPIKKICIIGPESTGKSTLSKALAAHYKTVWNPEFAREYLKKSAGPYAEMDLLRIAEGQIQTEDSLFKRANRYLFCDTDLYVIKVWSESSFGQCHLKILQQIAGRKYDLYLLTNIDIPWMADPLREHPKPKDRIYFYKQYQDIVVQSGIPWVEISGNYDERLASAISAIEIIFYNKYHAPFF